jgi:hypothetical protein
MTTNTHTVAVTITGQYPHGAQPRASVTVAGDGSIDHMLDAFRAALVAAGFAAQTAAQLTIAEPH